MKQPYRWTICSLLFFGTTINFIDRQVLSILAPQLQTAFHWTEADYGYIVMAFQIAYAAGLLFTGHFLDRFGVRLGYSIAMIFWSLSAAGHALASSVISFASARFCLALGESANFPAAIKTVAEWFPKKERAFATGLFNTGATVGVIVSPVLISRLALNFGWQAAFVAAGILGVVWLFFWLLFYGQPEKKASKKELDYIRSDSEKEEEKQDIPWLQLLRSKQTLGICIGRFVTDPIWWFFLFWLPKYLHGQFGLDIGDFGLPLIIIYTVSSLGGVSGGWLSSWFIRRGKSIDFARKTTILIAALAVMPIVLLAWYPSFIAAIVLISLATAAHQAWGANIYTVVSDIYPQKTVGSVIGLTSFAGAVGGIIFSPTVGWILAATNSYFIIFLIAGAAYLVAWLALKIFVSIQPVKYVI
ncbi:MAG: MFS transporter [Tannerella sp.]|jgi:ACS family hexuronate transporter-like MFS transporter|nr:MFS transporter [Tannerella sp.]